VRLALGVIGWHGPGRQHGQVLGSGTVQFDAQGGQAHVGMPTMTGVDGVPGSRRRGLVVRMRVEVRGRRGPRGRPGTETRVVGAAVARLLTRWRVSVMHVRDQ